MNVKLPEMLGDRIGVPGETKVTTVMVAMTLLFQVIKETMHANPRAKLALSVHRDTQEVCRGPRTRKRCPKTRANVRVMAPKQPKSARWTATKLFDLHRAQGDKDAA